VLHGIATRRSGHAVSLPVACLPQKGSGRRERSPAMP
jgi:hypothetical protein